MKKNLFYDKKMPRSPKPKTGVVRVGCYGYRYRRDGKFVARDELNNKEKNMLDIAVDKYRKTGCNPRSVTKSPRSPRKPKKNCRRGLAKTRFTLKGERACKKKPGPKSGRSAKSIKSRSKSASRKSRSKSASRKSRSKSASRKSRREEYNEWKNEMGEMGEEPKERRMVITGQNGRKFLTASPESEDDSEEMHCKSFNDKFNCEDQYDDNGMRRCRYNFSKNACEKLPSELKERATYGVGGSASYAKYEAPERRKLSQERLKPYSYRYF